MASDAAHSSQDRPTSRPPPHAPVVAELARASDIRLEYVRCRACHRDPAFEEEHATECIALVKRGVFTYRADRRAHVLSPGWMILGNAGEPYVCSHEHGQDRGDDCVALRLSGRATELIRSAAGAGKGRRAFAAACLPPLPRVSALMRALEDSSRRLGPERDLSETAFAVASHILRELASLGAARRPAAPTPSRAIDRERIRLAVEFIEHKAAQPLSLEVIARAVDLSPFHFLRLFHRQVGVTPHQYLIRARLRRAVDLLRDSTLPVTEVALEVGFGDLSNFVRTFHREVGCPPQRFRRGALGDGSALLQLRRQPSLGGLVGALEKGARGSPRRGRPPARRPWARPGSW